MGALTVCETFLLRPASYLTTATRNFGEEFLGIDKERKESVYGLYIVTRCTVAILAASKRYHTISLQRVSVSSHLIYLGFRAFDVCRNNSVAQRRRIVNRSSSGHPPNFSQAV